MNYCEMYRVWNDAVAAIRGGGGSAVVSSLEEIVGLLQQKLRDEAAESQANEKAKQNLTLAFTHLGTALYQRWKRYGERDPSARDALADAHESLKQALALDPNCAEAMIQVGVILEEHRDLEGAARWFRRALEVNPASFDAWNDLGMVLHQQGDLKGARDCYEKAIKTNPFAADALSNLGEVHREMGDLYRAAECYRKAIAAAPNHKVAAENLARVTLLMRSALGAGPQIPIARAPAPDLGDQPRIERVVRTAMDGLAAGKLNFDQAIAFLLTIEDKGTEVYPLTETLMKLGADHPNEAMAVSGQFMASPRLRQREMFVYVILGAYVKDPERYLQALVDLARNDHEWVKFAVAESLLAGRARWRVSPQGSIEAALGIALALLDSRDKTVREKAYRYLGEQWICPLDRHSLSQEALALLSEFEARGEDLGAELQ